MGDEECRTQCLHCVFYFFSSDFVLLQVRHHVFSPVSLLSTEANSVHGQNRGSHGDLCSLFGGGGLSNNLLSLSFCISEKVVFRKREGWRVSQLEREDSQQSAWTQASANKADKTRPRNR